MEGRELEDFDDGDFGAVAEVEEGVVEVKSNP